MSGINCQLIVCIPVVLLYFKKEAGKEGTCLFDSTTIYNNYLYGTNNSQATVAQAKQSRYHGSHRTEQNRQLSLRFIHVDSR